MDKMILISAVVILALLGGAWAVHEKMTEDPVEAATDAVKDAEKDLDNAKAKAVAVKKAKVEAEKLGDAKRKALAGVVVMSIKDGEEVNVKPLSETFDSDTNALVRIFRECQAWHYVRKYEPKRADEELTKLYAELDKFRPKK